MTDRYAHFLEFMLTLEAIRWNLIGFALMFLLGYVVIRFLLPERERRWAMPLYCALVMAFVYGIMFVGMLTAE